MYRYCNSAFTSHLFLHMDSFFKQKVSKSRSAVKISDQVLRDDPSLIDAVFWSSGLGDIFKENLKNDPELRYSMCTDDVGKLMCYNDYFLIEIIYILAVYLDHLYYW